MPRSTLTSAALDVANEYTAAWTRKDAAAIATLMHPDVHFKGALAETRGRDAFLGGAQRMFPLLKDYRVRTIATTGDQAIFAYDFVCIDPVGIVRTAEVITVRDGLITDVELLFDPRPFEKLAAAKTAQK